LLRSIEPDGPNPAARAKRALAEDYDGLCVKDCPPWQTRGD
jgi:hypothetical protein